MIESFLPWEAKLYHAKRLFLAKNIVMMKFVYLNNEKVEKGNKHQVRKGSYANIIDEVAMLFRVDREDLNALAIRRCMYTHQRLQVSHQGPMSPMEGIEANNVAVVFQLEMMKEPMSASEGLHLANSLIKDAIYEDKVMELKKKHLREN
jgi:hypothetical protein